MKQKKNKDKIKMIPRESLEVFVQIFAQQNTNKFKLSLKFSLKFNKYIESLSLISKQEEYILQEKRSKFSNFKNDFQNS